jgi:tetratricopeptide (TPR) repeat protein
MIAGSDSALRQAIAFHRGGLLAEAALLYRRILAENPRQADALHLLGVTEFQKGDALLAVTLMDQAITLDPNNAGFRSNLGLVLEHLGRVHEAIGSYDRALAIKPDSLETLSNRGKALHGLARFQEALDSYERALAINACDAATLNNRGSTLAALGRLEDALASIEQALAAKPDYADAQYNRGSVLLELEQLDGALASFDRVLTDAPDHAAALNNRGVTLQRLGRFEEALRDFDKALSLQGDRLPEVLYNRGRCKLLVGSLASGWIDYEYRWNWSGFRQKRSSLPIAHWAGEPLRGRSILIYEEQGLGDTIQFCRYLPLLVERGGQVSFMLRPSLSGLLASLSADIRLITSVESDSRFDFQCPLMSLPLLMETDLGNIPSSPRYLSGDLERSARWRGRLGSQGFKIGICWQGNAGRIDIGRSFPLSEFYPLTRLPGVRLISVQKNRGVEQFAQLPQDVHIETLGDDFDAGADAFVDTAAVMENLDLIITADTSIAHLGGALGRPTWVALRHVPDWRWLLNRSDSPWYPAIRLFRQAVPNQWGPVFAEIVSEVKLLLARREQPASESMTAVGH